MRRVLFACLLACCIATARAETAVFLDMEQAELRDASAYLSQLLGQEILLGPGAGGRITIVSTRAMTYREVLAAFEAELARNGMTAFRRGNAMLVVPAAVSASAATTVPATRPAVSDTPRSARFQPVVMSMRERAEDIARRLRAAGIASDVVTVGDTHTPGFGVTVEVGLDAASRKAFAERVSAAGLSALVSIDPRR